MNYLFEEEFNNADIQSIISLDDLQSENKKYIDPFPPYSETTIQRESNVISEEDNIQSFSEIILSAPYSQSSVENNSKNQEKIEKKNIFIDNKGEDLPIKKEELNNNAKKEIKFFVKSTLPCLKGRKRKGDRNYENKKIHNKYSVDNIQRKIKVHFMTFIIHFANAVLKNYGYKQSFSEVRYDEKKNVNKEDILKLKSIDIGEILKKKISDKFLKNKDNNKQIYEEVIQNENIKYIFSLKCIYIFKNYYYKDIKDKKNFKFDDVNININLSNSKIKIFEDLLKKNGGNNNEYTKKIKEIAKKYFLE